MTTLLHAVRCLDCGAEGAPDLFATSCDQCGGSWLEACYDLPALPDDWPSRVAARPTDMWRYGELLPFPEEMPALSLGEGWTPLIRAAKLPGELGLNELWIKDERQHPTGSFKDRQAAATVRALAAQGVKELAMASTGNAAAAYAAFCARAGIKLWVFLTSTVPAEKMRELGLYGAEVIKITGSYDQAKIIGADFARRRGIPFERGAQSMLGRESMKTLAFEIAEQMEWSAPDWYVQAVSGGIGPLGVHKGFHELKAAGLIDRVPRLAIIQVEGCAPMVHAWEASAPTAEPVEPDTLITVLATGNPGRSYELLKHALDEDGGAMVSVDDGEAFRAMRRMARSEGFSVEPAVSVAFAGAEKLLAEGHIAPDARVVINCSGHTFSAEKHALEDRYVFHLEMEDGQERSPSSDGLLAALEQLDEQVTTIAIIDDNPHDSRLIRRLLQNYKTYRVFEAHNGPDGIDLVRQRRPDLVVLDLTLPDMDGFAILDELKRDARTAEIPVIIISAKSLTADERQHLKEHTESIWQKGNFTARDLVSHVVEMLGANGSDGPIGEADRSAARSGPEMVEMLGTMERQRILVVDDNVLDARLMRRLFEQLQHIEVCEAHTATEALEAIDESPPDLIILDLRLPDMAGEKLLEVLTTREETRTVPIIVVSAKDLDARAQAQLAERADSVWLKADLDRSSLLAHVESVLPVGEE